jgi:hypothetical protein
MATQPSAQPSIRTGCLQRIHSAKQPSNIEEQPDPAQVLLEKAVPEPVFPPEDPWGPEAS